MDEFKMQTYVKSIAAGILLTLGCFSCAQDAYAADATTLKWISYYQRYQTCSGTIQCNEGYVMDRVEVTCRVFANKPFVKKPVDGVHYAHAQTSVDCKTTYPAIQEDSASDVTINRDSLYNLSEMTITISGKADPIATKYTRPGGMGAFGGPLGNAYTDVGTFHPGRCSPYSLHDWINHSTIGFTVYSPISKQSKTFTGVKVDSLPLVRRAGLVFC